MFYCESRNNNNFLIFICKMEVEVRSEKVTVQIEDVSVGDDQYFVVSVSEILINIVEKVENVDQFLIVVV